MTKEITYKLQGDGRDSWIVTEKDDSGEIINKYMVYENPELENIGAALKAVMTASPEELQQIKKLLGII